MGIGKKIKDLADLKSINLKELSKKADISYNTLYAIVKRDNDTVKPDILYKIAAALDLTYEEMLTKIYHDTSTDFVNKFYNGDITPDNITDSDIDELITSVYQNSFIRNELEREKLYQYIKKIIISLCKLSLSGQEEAVKRVEELTHIIRYQNIRLQLEAPEIFESDNSTK